MAVAGKKRKPQKRKWKRSEAGGAEAKAEFGRLMEELFADKYPWPRPDEDRDRNFLHYEDSITLVRAIRKNPILKKLGVHALDTASTGWLSGTQILKKRRIKGKNPKRGRPGRPRADESPEGRQGRPGE